VFETALVERGQVHDLDGHLNRLAISLRELYGVELEPDAALRTRSAALAIGFDRARLRILASPGGSLEITVAPAQPTAAEPVVLTPFTLAGGLGRHKWQDRRLLDALAAEVPGTVPLLVDTDGLVLEAAYANVWIVEGPAVITPPDDGRILPGVTRAGLLRTEAAAAEEPISLGRFERAEAIFLTSSIRRRHPARLAG
jgi:para-aminobenzoate synthetase/4-amino-4-deoxychorismate lyase